ncbi:hypothetical protein YPPY13_3677 [Yersinia pestis PY-13]|nr:hypothetical protein YPPY06_3695 [Yersinia pestis PY-06]EIR43034.1 hypothetical protein YPPY13_3677 [Yersinia pestis PY-13]EIR62096.1 hypothetical protein YPPY25_3688 [Yersinia pestis PY-25]EIR73968.1 hypothetical protein YPPY32_3947 [Yersinia pestis PY-32]EIR87526.1 hypothetical protein YPPY42_3697 [Yersinia pestis PY-42]EIS14764.1 hypothetical protein YPPY52_3727 [Yersinia pestis PY-52]EIS29107.1 hypothetical protein YPPY56_3728 [Yersinia pestis PY-56]EIS40812.1 hypothetical protein YPP
MAWSTNPFTEKHLPIIGQCYDLYFGTTQIYTNAHRISPR